MSRPSFEDRIRAAFDAEAAELERRRTSQGTDRRAANVEPEIEVLELPQPEPVRASRRRWVLPVAAAAALIAILGVVGLNNLRESTDELVDSAPATLPSDDVEPGTPAAAAQPDVGQDASQPGSELPSPVAPAAQPAPPTPTSVAELFEAPDIEVPPDPTTAPSEVPPASFDPGPTPSTEPPQALPGPPPPSTPEPGPLEPPPVSETLLSDIEYCVTGIFSPDVLNVRGGPATDFNIVYELEQGECGISLTNNNPVRGWRTITVAGVNGWVASNFITVRDPGPGVVCVQGVALGETLNLRTGPGVEFEIVAELLEGECVNARGAAVDGWFAVDNGGVFGWASANFLAPPGSIEPPELQLAPVVFRLNPITADAPLPNITAFEVTDVSNGVFVSDRYLAPDGSIAIPLGLLPRTLRISGPLPGDAFCWWTGQVLVERTAEPTIYNVDVALLCA